jgi:hypothetical protein
MPITPNIAWLFPTLCAFRGVWGHLNSSPLDKPASGRIAVKVINHRGDEVMKVFKVR